MTGQQQKATVGDVKTGFKDKFRARLKLMAGPIAARLNSKRAKLLAILVTVVVVGASAYGAYKILHKPAPAKQNSTTVRNNINELEKQSTSLSGQSKFNAVSKLWEDYLKTKPPQDVLFEVYVQLGNSYLNGAKYDKAKDAFIKAQVAAGKDTPAVVYGLALIAQRTGDKAGAISNYEKAISLTREELKGSSLTDANKLQALQNIAGYQAIIEQLKAAL
jgi:tetratricopeptide (TPR) repeat protein